MSRDVYLLTSRRLAGGDVEGGRGSSCDDEMLRGELATRDLPTGGDASREEYLGTLRLLGGGERDGGLGTSFAGCAAGGGECATRTLAGSGTSREVNMLTSRIVRVAG